MRAGCFHMALKCIIYFNWLDELISKEMHRNVGNLHSFRKNTHEMVYTSRVACFFFLDKCKSDINKKNI